MFGGVKRAGHALFGGMFDGQPGAFSQHDGGLQALLGMGGRVPAEAGADPWAQMVAMGNDPQAGKVPGPPKPKPREPGAMTWGDRLHLIGGALKDMDPYSRGGGSFDAAREEVEGRRKAERSQAAAADQRAALTKIAQSVITDPREWMLFQMDPQGWAKANASRFEAYTAAPGSVRGVGGDVLMAVPDYKEVGDQVVRTGLDGVKPVYTRLPTYAEITGRMTQEEARRHNQATEGLGRDIHNTRKASGGYGTPGVGVAGGNFPPPPPGFQIVSE